MNETPPVWHHHIIVCGVCVCVFEIISFFHLICWLNIVLFLVCPRIIFTHMPFVVAIACKFRNGYDLTILLKYARWGYCFAGIIVKCAKNIWIMNVDEFLEMFHYYRLFFKLFVQKRAKPRRNQRILFFSGY